MTSLKRTIGVILVFLIMQPLKSIAINTNSKFSQIHVLEEMDSSSASYLLFCKDTYIVIGETFDKSFDPEDIDLMFDDLNVFICVFDLQWNYLQGVIYGGDGNDIATGALINKNNQLCISGNTNSSELNILSEKGSKREHLLGQSNKSNVFFSCFSLNDLSLEYCTNLNGNGLDFCTDIAYDQRNYYLVGHTSSTNLPITEDAIQKEKLSESSLYVVVLSESFDLRYCSYYGEEEIWKALLDIDLVHGRILVCGMTFEKTCPEIIAHNTLWVLTPGEYSILDKFNVGEKGFTGITALQWVNAHEFAYYGYTNDDHYKTTPGSFQPEVDKGSRSCFITFFDMNTNEIAYSSFLGGEGNDESVSFKVVQGQKIIATGKTWSNHFPVTYDAERKALNKNGSAPFACLFQPYSALSYSTLVEDLGAIRNSAIDIEGNRVFFTGRTKRDKDSNYYTKAVVLIVSMDAIDSAPILPLNFDICVCY